MRPLLITVALIVNLLLFCPDLLSQTYWHPRSWLFKCDYYDWGSANEFHQYHDSLFEKILTIKPTEAYCIYDLIGEGQKLYNERDTTLNAEWGKWKFYFNHVETTRAFNLEGNLIPPNSEFFADSGNFVSGFYYVGESKIMFALGHCGNPGDWIPTICVFENVDDSFVSSLPAKLIKYRRINPYK